MVISSPTSGTYTAPRAFPIRPRSFVLGFGARLKLHKQDTTLGSAAKRTNPTAPAFIVTSSVYKETDLMVEVQGRLYY